MKNSQRGLGAVFVVVIIIAVVLLIGDWMNSRNGVTQTRETIPNSSLQNEDSAKIYKSSEYGYSFKYPQSAQLHVFNPKRVIVEPDTTKGSISIEVVHPSEACSTSSGSDPSIKSINGVAFSLYNVDKLVSGQMITDGSYGSATGRLYCTVKNKRGYRLITQLPYVGAAVQVEDDVVINKILESFRFE